MRDAGTQVRLVLAEAPCEDFEAKCVIAKIEEIAADLRMAMQPSELTFLNAGERLASSLETLRNVEDSFAQLADAIAGSNLSRAMNSLHSAVQDVTAIVDRDNTKNSLNCLWRAVNDLRKPLQELQVLAKEVGLLVMNGKVLVSQIETGNSDFSSFNEDMQKLGDIAAMTANHALNNLLLLLSVISKAMDGSAALVLESKQEITEVQLNVTDGLKILDDRREMTGRAIEHIRQRAGSQAEHVAQSVQALQINDITSQRIEHAASALCLLNDCLKQDVADPAKQLSLASLVCRLQTEQILSAKQEHDIQTGILASNLSSLADDAKETTIEALSTLGANSSQISFAGTLEAEVSNAVKLVRKFAETRMELSVAMSAVRQALTDIVSDLNVITSIRADMHIMGLNATLKCGQLGSRARGFAVVAQNLRVCSARTEEVIQRIESKLQEIHALQIDLDELGGISEKDQLERIIASMTSPLKEVNILGDYLNIAIEQLQKDGGIIAGNLAEAAQLIGAQNEVGNDLARISGELQRFAELVPEQTPDCCQLQDEVNNLLAEHYTMSSERLIHQLVAGDRDQKFIPSAGQSAVLEIDSCFF